MTDEQLSVAMFHTAQREMRAFRLAEMTDHPPRGPNAIMAGGRPKRFQVTLEEYEACAAQGMSAAEAARHLKVSGDACAYMARQYGVKFRDGRKKS